MMFSVVTGSGLSSGVDVEIKPPSFLHQTLLNGRVSNSGSNN